MNKTVFTFCFFVILGFLTSSCQIDNSNKSRYIDSYHNVKHFMNATVTILERNSDGNLSSPRCTAFYINKRELVTALHCVYKQPSGSVELAPGILMLMPGIDKPKPVLGKEVIFLDRKSHDQFLRNFSPDEEPNITHAKVVSIDFENDLALLKLNKNEPDSKHWLKTSNRPVLIGERIYGMSMPRSQFWVLTEGIVSSKRITPYGKETILHQAHVAPGASGSPIINERGRVVGVNIAFVAKTNYLAVASPSTVVFSFVNERPSVSMTYVDLVIETKCDDESESCEE